MTLFSWLLVCVGVFTCGFRLGIAWRDVEAELAEQQRAVAESRRRERLRWPSTWGEG